MRKSIAFIVFLLFDFESQSQTLGGNAVFSFLKMPASTQLSALGGVNVSAISSDVSLALQNPALLKKEMHGQINSSFNQFIGGIKNLNLSSGFHVKKWNTNIGIGIQYLNYGNIPETDASGNILGTFKPLDYAFQMMFSKQHKNNWHYGATVKWIQSNYAIYKSNGIGFDVALSYLNDDKDFQASVVVNNLGTHLKSYNGSSIKEELPFDLKMGVSKKLKHAPFQFSLTAHNVHRFDIFYNDTAFLLSEGVDNFRNKKNTFNKILSHLVLSSQIFIKENIELTLGYNFLRRKDLNVQNYSNGFNGFALGAGLHVRKLQIRYSTGFYQQNAFHQFGINYSTN